MSIIYKKLLQNKQIIRLAILMFALIIYVMVGFSLFKIIRTTAPDFPSFYSATRDLLHHTNPYTDKHIPIVYNYPAVTTLFILPLVLLPYQIAQGLFVILSALSVPAIIFFGVKLCYKKFSYTHILIFTSLAFLSFPTKFTLGMGQINLFALLALLSGYYLFANKQFGKAGLLVGISFLLKPILGFLIIFFLIQKAWKLLVIVLLCIAGFVLLSSIIYGFSIQWYYAIAVTPGLLNSVAGREVYYNQGLMGFISRLTNDFAIRKYATEIIGSLLIIVTIFIVIRRKASHNFQFALFLTLLPLAHTLSWQHHFVVLFFPFILATKIILQKKRYFLFSLLVVAYGLVSWNIKNPGSLHYFPINLVLSHTFFGGMLLLVILFSLLITNKGKL